MNTYSSLKKRNNGTVLGVVALALCVLLSGSMLFSRLVGFTTRPQQQIIPLTKANGNTSITVLEPQRNAAARPHSAVSLSNPVIANQSADWCGNPVPLQSGPVLLDEENPGFEIEDGNTVWVGQTNVEIFRVSYDNESGDITVDSAGGDKILAPGTSNEYVFSLKNTGNVNLDYEVTIEAFFSDGEKVIPVQARLSDYQGNYLVGSADSYADVLDLDGVKASGSLTAGYIAPYTLQWQWPFEGDDTYDTLLGNLVENEDISLTIVINTTATQGGEGGLPETGDTSGVVAMAVIMVASFAGMLILLLLPKRKGEAKNG